MKRQIAVATTFAVFAILAAPIPPASAKPSHSEWTPDRDTIARFEKVVRLPKGADPLASYDRYYTGVYISGRKVVEGVYTTLPSPHPNPGIHIVSVKNLPGIEDGGCGIVTVYYDMATAKPAGAYCNGLA